MSNKEQFPMIKSWVRWVLIAVGTVSVGLGILGIFLPVLPTTPFLLLAAFCYGRSSQRLYRWLLYNRWFGKYIRNYIQKKGIPLTLKVWTIGVLWLAIGTSAAFAVESLVVRLVLVAIAIGVTTHLIMIPTYYE